ncbi:hypothetical protein ACFQBQ_17020 [Granulicella cerasi]|uniref:NfeD integral membrane domain-containing protein n=1 Tax=Granulicella cerasi TaxID=741063 RepID=A0ABW1ZFP8_9BACT|nr:hypothetical protein [Granulicella cerasi]
MLPLPFAPALTLLLITVGGLLLAWEANHPGSMLPGGIGLIAVLIALASVMRSQDAAEHVSGLIAAFAAMLASFRWPKRWLFGIAAALWVGAFLAIGPRWVAILCAAVLAVATSLLAEITARARRNKALR